MKTSNYNTPSIPKLIWVKNVRAIVVCGFLMKFLKKHILKIWKKSWVPFGSYLLNSTADSAQFEWKWAGLALKFEIRRLKAINDFISWYGEHSDYLLSILVSRTGTVGWTQCQSVLLLLWFWPLAASITMEVKNDHATTQRILKEFIEINFSLGCMVWLLCCLFQNWLPVKILIYLLN